MVFPLWYLVGLVLAWAVLPFAMALTVDLVRARRLCLSVRHHQWFWAYLFLSVSLGWATLFLFYPLAQATGQSLTNLSLTDAAATRWVGLANYRALLSDRFWWRAVLTTLIFVGGTLPVHLLVSLFLAMQII